MGISCGNADGNSVQNVEFLGINRMFASAMIRVFLSLSTLRTVSKVSRVNIRTLCVSLIGI